MPSVLDTWHAAGVIEAMKISAEVTRAAQERPEQQSPEKPSK